MHMPSAALREPPAEPAFPPLLEWELAAAAARGQFRLEWQPKVTARTRELVGFEALLRWHHPQLGLIPPGSFIPLAERSGAILGLGEWVLHAACREAAPWARRLRVAVNVSPLQLQHPLFARQLRDALGQSGLDPSRLELEVTEDVSLEGCEAALREARALGVGVALDDFGSGHASLGVLRRFPFDRLKLDRAYVAEMGRSRAAAAIVRAVIGLGKELGVPVTAEGVETEAQAAALAELSCQELQGFLLGRPRPIAAYAGLLGGRAAMLAA